MHQDVDRAPLLLDPGDDGLDLCRVLDVEGLEQGGSQGSPEIADPSLETALVVRETADAELGAGGIAQLGDAPGVRLVVGDAVDEGLLAMQFEEPGRRGSASDTRKRSLGRFVADSLSLWPAPSPSGAFPN